MKVYQSTLFFLFFISSSTFAAELIPNCNGKPLIGRVERVQIENLPIGVTAKIDTGADMSSLSATDIKYFIQDNHYWVHFVVSIPPTHQQFVFSKPLVGSVGIKKRSEDQNREGQPPKSVPRPIILLTIQIAGHKYETLFNLVDRNRFQYPVLIGVNTIKQMHAVVDIN